MIKLIYPTLILFLISCNNKKVEQNKTDSNSLDSLQNIIENRDSIVNVLLDQKTQLISTIQNDIEINNPNQLYKPIIPIKLKDYKYIKLFNSLDTSLNFLNMDISVRLYVSGNGPSDPEKDYCNGSSFLYIATSQVDFPPEENLFEIGPYDELKIVKVDKENSVLYFHHEIRGKRKNEKISIYLDKVVIDK